MNYKGLSIQYYITNFGSSESKNFKTKINYISSENRKPIP